MAETWGMFHDDEAARSPSANSHKLLWTATYTGPFSLHVCNRNAADVTIRVAVLKGADAAAYTDGATPPAYSYITYGRRVEGDGGEGDTIAMSLEVGYKLVVWADTANVNFSNFGIGFS